MTMLPNFGFTGTQDGMTPEQFATTDLWFKDREPAALNHGACIGADAEVHELALAHGWVTWLHPGYGKNRDESRRAHCHGAAFIENPLPFLERNMIIVNRSSFLLATPGGPEKLRSGTWHTIRYAMRVNLDGLIIWPNGSVQSLDHYKEEKAP